jgi:hypothetical protein
VPDFCVVNNMSEFSRTSLTYLCVDGSQLQVTVRSGHLPAMDTEVSERTEAVRINFSTFTQGSEIRDDAHYLGFLTAYHGELLQLRVEQ